jgi:hypothetical protein
MQEYLDQFKIEYTYEEIFAKGGRNFEKFMKRPRVAKTFEELLSLLPRLISPKLTYGIFTIAEMRDNSLVILNNLGTQVEIGTGVVFHKCMKEATELILAIGTLGSKIDEQIALYNGSNQMGSVILDLLGSWVIRDIQKQAAVKIIDQNRIQGKFSSIVLIPGDNGWDIQDHEKIFQLVDPSIINVRLKSISVIEPVKSICFAMGVSNKQFEIHDVERCFFCPNQKTCDWSPYGNLKSD